MGIIKLDDLGNEVLRGAAEVNPDDNKYDLRTKIISSTMFTAPSNSDTVTVEYPSATVEVYKYRVGGITGTIIKTITVTYTSSSKKDLDNVVVT